eukprot:Skav217084  [mRNA]  locus=scaffold1308:125731:130313:- [translate_table: standard]
MERYERLRELGRGSYGCAVLVRDRNSRQQRVVKEIDLSRMPSLAQKEAKNEVDVLRCLKHPNIVAYCDSFLEGRMLCIVMEFADGGDLSQLIKRKKSISEVLRESEVLPIFVQCLLALHYVHKLHILHRDIKSQNIFLTLSGAVKLGDFGIAKVLDHTAAEAITMIGTPIYLAPEVCHSKPYGIKADVWSIGVVLYELLALVPPFTGTNMAALMNNIVTAAPKELPDLYSASIKELVIEILQKMPEMRPTVSEILDRAMIRAVAEMLPAWSLHQPAQPSQDLTMPRFKSQPDLPPDLPQSVEDGHRKICDRRRPPLPAPDSARAACEYRQNREAALAAKARVLGTSRRSLSAEPGPTASSASACERAAREAEHLLALQQAAAQARRDRQHVQQRRQAEKEANAARYQVEKLEALQRIDQVPSQGPCPAEHLADLQEAAAQARRDRRYVQQKVQELEKNAESHAIWNLTDDLHEVSQDGARSDGRSPRRSAQKDKEEQEHLLQLQEARAQARRDRKMLDAKRKALDDASDSGWDLAPDSRGSCRGSPRLSAIAEAKHMQALKEASAEARRERKMLQQKALDDLHGNCERPSSGESDAKRILENLADAKAAKDAKAEAQRVEEERRYRELREASAQARRERKFLQQKVREIEWGDGHVVEETLSRHSSPVPHGVPPREDHSKSRRLSTLGFAGKLSLSRPASEERSFQSIERTCEDPDRSRIPMHAVHISTSMFPEEQDPQESCRGHRDEARSGTLGSLTYSLTVAFLIFRGKINLFLDPNGVGEKHELTKGAIFGEKHFRCCGVGMVLRKGLLSSLPARLGDESMLDMVGGAAQCEEPCIIGVAGLQ